MLKSDRTIQLWLAFVLLTRLPFPHLPKDTFAQGARAVWAYPLVGLLVGTVGVLIGQLAFWAGLPSLIAAILAVSMMILITGAMHEDGLADVFDGFWGGFDPTRRLEIMRDSQIGTYGVLALSMVTLLRIAAIAELMNVGWLAIVPAAMASRALMPLCMYALPHARGDGLSHSVGKPPFAAVAFAGAIGSLAVMLGFGIKGILIIIVAAGVSL
ncbi:UNVERIFIED_CONTAM: hypothetical protein GTU68_023938, partial [Idotea baltica]|nr:hypothetical protein [Idotea baltica]